MENHNKKVKSCHSDNEDTSIKDSCWLFELFYKNNCKVEKRNIFKPTLFIWYMILKYIITKLMN